MDRRWRGPQGQEALKSLSSFHEYKDRLNDLPARLNCATAADVYSVYSCLHAAGKSSQVGCDAGGAFTYLQVIHQAEECSSKDASPSTPAVDIIVPVSASYTDLTPALISRLLDISSAEPACIVLAIVDSDGTVVLNRLYRGIQAPAEGFTGTDTLGTGKRIKPKIKEPNQKK
ncbi:hypothetical protein ABBQ38_008949 [Trebouxia sp. C0009 RCD-2024]